MSYSATGDSVRIYEQVPQLARLRSDVLLGDVWKQPELAFRDRVLVTLGVLAAGGKVEEMKAWMSRGVEAGLTLDELRGLVVQVTFYAGWPAGLAAGRAALELFEADAPLFEAEAPLLEAGASLPGAWLGESRAVELDEPIARIKQLLVVARAKRLLMHTATRRRSSAAEAGEQRGTSPVG